MIMNQAITIPRKITQKGDMVLIPRTEYEAMRRSLQERSAVSLKNTLDGELAKSLAEYRAGKHYGPFDTAKEAIAFLKAHRNAKK